MGFVQVLLCFLAALFMTFIAVVGLFLLEADNKWAYTRRIGRAITELFRAIGGVE